MKVGDFFIEKYKNIMTKVSIKKAILFTDGF
jgi:hypothetical protein